MPGQVLVAGREVQKGLFVLGFDPGPIDGIVGQQTNAALGRYLTSTITTNDWNSTILEDRSAVYIRPAVAAEALQIAARQYQARQRAGATTDDGLILPTTTLDIQQGVPPWVGPVVLMGAVVLAGTAAYFMFRGTK